MKRISVIIPAFNHAQYIGDAIQSVLNCNFPNLEIIVIDDGSADNTQEVVSSFETVQYHFQENQGAHSALNYGISKASGEYIAILNDDDLFLPDHLILAYSNLEIYGNDLYLGKASLIGNGWKFDSLSEHVSQSMREIQVFGLIKSLFHINWSLSTTSFVFSRDLVRRMGGFQNFSMCHDLDFLLRALMIEGVSAGTSSQATWEYRCHESNSGSAISTKKQKAEIAYCLGRVISQTTEIAFCEDFSNLIGHGISVDLKYQVWDRKPWENEGELGTDNAITIWVKAQS